MGKQTPSLCSTKHSHDSLKNSFLKPLAFADSLVSWPTCHSSLLCYSLAWRSHHIWSRGLLCGPEPTSYAGPGPPFRSQGRLPACQLIPTLYVLYGPCFRDPPSFFMGCPPAPTQYTKQLTYCPLHPLGIRLTPGIARSPSSLVESLRSFCLVGWDLWFPRWD